MTWTIEDILDEATPPETVVSLCLRGDLVGQYEALEAKFNAAPPTIDRRSLGDVSERTVIAQQMEELRDQMLAKQADFKFRAMDPKRFSDVHAAQPEAPMPPTVTGDEAADAEIDASYLAARSAYLSLMFDWFTGIIVASCYEPKMTLKQANALSKKLSTQQWHQLQDAAFSVNTDQQQIPFSAAASALLLRTAQK